ncbi:MAG TPA: glycosyl hydrolase [Parapedobacter sp.]|uniref:glycosyl hydrolase n=1 Tax=Parapedobacter sp. TaxID=1958893 RepID=UPI002BD03649|nr:glycosyl hydrolase [Parapedobacter sp.]HWK57810.1 glycosyl hydrolase [Parapedobacter sp.]
MKNLTKLLFLGVFAFVCCTPDKQVTPDINQVARVFREAPDTIQTSIFWYWISDHISKEGVVKDLHAMKRVGINRAFIGNIGLDNVPYGNVKILSDEWWETLHTALKTATELDIEIGIFNSPGWSQSGGPWVEPHEAMRYLAATETFLKGSQYHTVMLPAPEGDFEDVNVLAFRAPEGYGSSFSDLDISVNTQPHIADAVEVVDKDHQTGIALPANQRSVIELVSTADYTARSLSIYPGKNNLRFDVTLEVLGQEGFQEVKRFTVDRSNNALNVGFEPFAPVIVSFDAVTSNTFRLVFDGVSEHAGVREIELSAMPKIEYYKEKTFARMHPTPLPYWHDYLWPRQVMYDGPALMIDKDQVLDITPHMDRNGQLSWEAPAGDWLVLRMGTRPTGVTNSPASPEGSGLEIDKMNSVHVAKHFDAFLGEIIRRIPAEDRKTWKMVVQDSYETGGQNWTDDFIAKFKDHMGYDPLPYLPVYYGYVVGSTDESDRFLWDLRRFVADYVAHEYVGGLRKISHKHGMKTWLENYGHWGFPGEFLQYGGQSDELAGEFWSEGTLGDIENRAASSAAHIYGKVKVSAESFTSSGNEYGRYPALLKKRGDRFFTEGINSTLLTLFIHQPYEDMRPGVNAWFGTEFNRFNTWFEDMGFFVDYLKRCNFMLQQGKYVADVAYFIGEDAPKMTGVQDPELPRGYSFDYINGEVIHERLSVKDGKFVLPDGMEYRVLVLPQLETMRPELLRKISELVQAGGCILGPRPTRSPSLQHYGEADKEVQRLAEAMWSGIDGTQNKVNTYGKGLVMEGMDMHEALAYLDIVPDCDIVGNDSVLFIHRTLPDAELYFISNQQDTLITFDAAFRTDGRQPELWNAVDGSMRKLPEFSFGERTTTVPLKLEAHESAFVVFREAVTDETVPDADLKNFPEPKETIVLEQPWQVSFGQPQDAGGQSWVFDQLVDWSLHPDPQINHFSGKAYYRTDFSVGPRQEEERLYLDVGEVVALARVKINGRPVGGVWTAPYRLDVTDAVVEGSNRLEIDVANTWVNRLIGDQKLPEHQRQTQLFVNQYTADSPLHRAGLLGPVRLLVMEN